MAKNVDANGFWEIKRNPISKVGVFPYYGRQISPECEPDTIYNVFRSDETLRDSVPTWDNPPKPFIDDHEMLGDGFTQVDERPVQGVVYNPEFDNGVLYADLGVYSEDIKEKIESGKKELSLGYFCKYKKESGVYNGQVYDFVQTDMVGNHIALVDAGRCGSDVRVFDKALKPVFDSMEIGSEKFVLNKNSEKDTIENVHQNQQKGLDMKFVELDEVKRLIRDAMNWGDEENPTAKLLNKLLDEKAVEATPVSATDSEEEEEKSEDECEEKKSEDEEPEEKEEKKSEDSMKNIMDSLSKIVKGLDKLLAKDEEEEKKSEDEDPEEKKSEDEEPEDKEKDKAEDAAVIFSQDSLNRNEDPATVEYLAGK